MNHQESYRRFLSRRPWSTRIWMRAMGGWLAVGDWMKDLWYGAPWEASTWSPPIKAEQPSYGIDDMPPDSVVIAIRVGSRLPHAVGFHGTEFQTVAQWEKVIQAIAAIAKEEAKKLKSREIA